jgi:hypothetical protein
MKQAIHRFLDDVSEICVVWPTIPVVGNEGERQTARVLNRELDAADAADVEVRSPDWATTAASHREWFIGDGVHLSGAGERAFQRTLLDAAQRCVGGLPAVPG